MCSRMCSRMYVLVLGSGPWYILVLDIFMILFKRTGWARLLGSTPPPPPPPPQCSHILRIVSIDKRNGYFWRCQLFPLGIAPLNDYDTCCCVCVCVWGEGGGREEEIALIFESSAAGGVRRKPVLKMLENETVTHVGVLGNNIIEFRAININFSLDCQSVSLVSMCSNPA